MENKPDVITEQRGDAETKQYRDEEHKQEMIPETEDYQYDEIISTIDSYFSA